MQTRNNNCSGNAYYSVLSADAIKCASDINNGVYAPSDVANLQALKSDGYENVTLDDLAAIYNLTSKVYFIFMREDFAAKIKMRNDLQFGDLCRN